jgi:hypothetical protein
MSRSYRFDAHIGQQLSFNPRQDVLMISARSPEEVGITAHGPHLQISTLQGSITLLNTALTDLDMHNIAFVPLPAVKPPEKTPEKPVAAPAPKAAAQPAPPVAKAPVAPKPEPIVEAPAPVEAAPVVAETKKSPDLFAFVAAPKAVTPAPAIIEPAIAEPAPLPEVLEAIVAEPALLHEAEAPARPYIPSPTAKPRDWVLPPGKEHVDPRDFVSA